jgi:hypothetical protein
MNKHFSKTVATILVAVMLLGFTAVFNARAYPPAPAFFLVPDSESFLSPPTTIGTLFHVWLNVSTTGNTFTYQYEVDYDSSQLNCTNAVYFAGATSDFFKGHTTVATGPDTSIAGFVSGGETLLGADVVPATATGKGIIDMTFNITASPPIGGFLTSLITANNANSYLLDPDLNTITPNFGDSTYLNTWAPPPAPHFEVVPSAQILFDGSIVRNLTTFNVDIAIKGLSAGWFANNASVELDYNSALIVPTGWSLNAAWSSAIFDNTTAGAFKVTDAIAVAPLTGDTTLATVTFMIWNQGSAPPRGFGDFDISPLALVNPTLGSFYGFYITLGPVVNGSVKVVVYSPTAPPFLSVSSASLGPNPSVGQLFNVTVTLNDVAAFENIIAVQFRLSFDKTKIYPVTSYEGPFLPAAAALQPGSLGTFFVEYTNDPDGSFGPHEVVGNMIFPDGTGLWHGPMLEGTGVVTIITFQLLYQSFGEGNYTTPLNIVDQEAIALDNLIDQNIITYAMSDPHNGTVTVTTALPGRMIDEYGGAVNSGMIQLVGAPYLQFPANAGIGPNMQMDMVEPQSWVWLHANVTYNYWPVQFKNVAFEVDFPNGTVYTKMSAFTDANGVATVGFRMPWPCDVNITAQDPNMSLIGVWTETSTVQLADITISDTLNWHYDYLVNIWKVTTDMFQYNHGQCVQIGFEYGSHATQPYPVLFVVSLVDELGVTVGIAEVSTTVSGATDCTYTNGTATVEICIPKWAYAGIATIHVDAFNMEPSQGGVALGPQYDGPTIAIQPY